MVNDSKVNQVIIGKIGSPHGLGGWVSIYSYTDPIENLFSYLPWALEKSNKPFAAHLVDYKLQGQKLIGRFEGCTDRDQAQHYTNAYIVIDRKQLPKTKKNQYYWSDLVGLDVSNQDGISLGKVESLMETGANDVLIIKGHKVHALPFIDDVILSVDLKANTMRVNWDPDF